MPNYCTYYARMQERQSYSRSRKRENTHGELLATKSSRNEMSDKGPDCRIDRQDIWQCTVQDVKWIIQNAVKKFVISAVN